MKKDDIDTGMKILITVFVTMAIAIITVLSIDSEVHEEIPTLDAKPIVKRQIEVIEKAGSVPDMPEVKEPILSDEDIMAIVAMKEAGNQELIGKVAVVATILNRCDYYGETVETVVYKPNQYSFDKDTIPNEDCYMAVKIALRERDLFPHTMMWFLPNDWSPYGDHYLKIQDHYFSYLEDEEDGNT